MKSKNPSRKALSLSRDEVGPEDGADPQVFFRKSSRKKINRKALQLCAQVAQTLSYVLSWESGDEVLRDLVVESVQPAPDASHLLVSVYRYTPAQGIDAGQVLEHLHRACARLRWQVAAAIHRKRAPELTFRVLPCGEGDR